MIKEVDLQAAIIGISMLLCAVSIFIAGWCVGTQMELNKWVQQLKEDND